MTSHNDDKRVMDSPSEMEFDHEDYEAMVDYIHAKQPHRCPEVGIICGAGMMSMANKLGDRYNVPYEDIPNFPVSTVDGHIGQFAFGTMHGKKVVVMQGRFHMYEGYPAWKVMSPVRVMKLMGVDTLIVTNSSEGLNPGYSVGDIMLMYDHIGIPTLSGLNPLNGKNDERFGPRFIDMARVYDESLKKSALKVAEKLKCSGFMKQGVYAMVGGPSLGTPAEARYLQLIGGDAVGMSTVPEVLAARHCGMRVLGLSLITSLVNMDYHSVIGMPQEEMDETVKWRAELAQDIIYGVVARMESS